LISGKPWNLFSTAEFLLIAAKAQRASVLAFEINQISFAPYGFNFGGAGDVSERGCRWKAPHSVV